jgi:hypothetical protein
LWWFLVVVLWFCFLFFFVVFFFDSLYEQKNIYIELAITCKTEDVDKLVTFYQFGGGVGVVVVVYYYFYYFELCMHVHVRFDHTAGVARERTLIAKTHKCKS